MQRALRSLGRSVSRPLSSARCTPYVIPIPAITATRCMSTPSNPYVTPGRSRMLEPADSYDDVVRAFQMPTPTHYNIGADISNKHAARSNATAMIFEDENGKVNNITYGQFISVSNKLANALRRDCGVVKGDRVAILMSQSPDTAATHMATYKLGAIAVPLFVLFKEEALEYRLRDSGAKVVVVEPSSLEVVRSIQKNLPNLKHIIVCPPMSSLTTVANMPKAAGVHSMTKLVEGASADFTYVNTLANDPAIIIYTSGTTGNPKGALHAHRTLLGHLPGVEFPQEFFPQPDDVFWTPADWAWIGGLIDVLLPAMHHGVPVVAHRAKKFDAEHVFHLIAKHKIRNMFMPPTALKLMRTVENPRRYNYSVRSIGSGGETLGEGLLDWGRQTFGLTINEFYGQTECNLVLGNCSSIMPVKPGSMGRPIPGQIVDIVDDDGKKLPQGQVGNIGVRAPHNVMFLGYFNRERDTKEKYAGDYLLTGDLGKTDTDGYFWFFGRKDDVITSAGYRIGPAEIEDCLLKHPSVLNVAAVGVPDEVRTEIVKVFIVLRDGKTPSVGSADEDALKKDIANYVKTRLAAHEYPREVEFVAALPMTTTGKIIRKDLRKMHVERKEREAAANAALKK